MDYKIQEGIELEKIYRGAKEYIARQGGSAMADRVSSGEMMKRNIRELKAVIFLGTGMLDFIAQVASESSDKVYTSRFQAFHLLMDESFTESTPVKILDDPTHEIFYVQRLTPSTEAAVRCSCPDFTYRFSWYLAEIGGLIGKPITYVKKTDRKSQNVGKVKSVCKHLFALYELLAEAKVIGLNERYPSEIDLTPLLR